MTREARNFLSIYPTFSVSMEHPKNTANASAGGADMLVNLFLFSSLYFFFCFLFCTYGILSVSSFSPIALPSSTVEESIKLEEKRLFSLHIFEQLDGVPYILVIVFSYHKI